MVHNLKNITKMLDLFDTIKPIKNDDNKLNLHDIFKNLYYQNDNKFFSWNIYNKIYMTSKKDNDNITDIIKNVLKDIILSEDKNKSEVDTKIFILKYYNFIELLKLELVYYNNKIFNIFNIGFTNLAKYYLANNIKDISKKYLLNPVKNNNINEIINILYKFYNKMDDNKENIFLNYHIKNSIDEIIKDFNSSINTINKKNSKDYKFLINLFENTILYYNILPKDLCISIKLKITNNLLFLLNTKDISLDIIFEDQIISKFLFDYINFFENKYNFLEYFYNFEESELKDIKNLNEEIEKKYNLNNKSNEDIKNLYVEEKTKLLTELLKKTTRVNDIILKSIDNEFHLFKLSYNNDKILIEKLFNKYFLNKINNLENHIKKFEYTSSKLMDKINIFNDIIINIISVFNPLKVKLNVEIIFREKFNIFISKHPLYIKYINTSIDMYINKIYIKKSFENNLYEILEKKIENIIEFSKYLLNIDLFLENYNCKLSKRLQSLKFNNLNINSKNKLLIETKFFNILKNIYPHMKTILNMDKIFYDINMNIKYREELSNIEIEYKSKDVEIFKDLDLKKLINEKVDCKILTTNVWSYIDNTYYKCNMPKEIEASKYLLEKFYSAKHLNRKLKWLYNSGSINSSLKIIDKTYNLLCTPLQFSFLYLFKNDNIFLKKDILSELKTTEVTFNKVMNILVKSKLIIIKLFNTKTEYKFNNKYYSNEKIINLINIKVNSENEDKINDKIIKEKEKREKEILVDTRIVKILKNIYSDDSIKDKYMNKFTLITNIKKSLSKYTDPPENLIIKRIEKAINMDYIKSKIYGNDIISYTYIP